jgi:hypothetical protein
MVGAQVTGYAEGFGARELRKGEQLVKNFKGPSLMGHDLGNLDAGLDRDHLDRQCADVDAYEGHGASELWTAGE